MEHALVVLADRLAEPEAHGELIEGDRLEFAVMVGVHEAVEDRAGVGEAVLVGAADPESLVERDVLDGVTEITVRNAQADRPVLADHTLVADAVLVLVHRVDLVGPRRPHVRNVAVAEHDGVELLAEAGVLGRSVEHTAGLERRASPR